MKIVHSICPRCSVGCGINLININNKLVGTYPYKRHPINEGKNCNKGRNCIEIVSDENRIKNPSINKKNSKWEETLDLAASKIKSYSPNEIGIIGSGNSTNEDLETLKNFADALGVTNIGFHAENFPKIAVKTATFDDVQNSNLILILGDVIKESPLLGRRIILASDNNAEVISVDTSNETFTGLNSDRYIQIENIEEFPNKIDQELIVKLTKSESMIIFNKVDSKKQFEEIVRIAKDTNSKILPVLNHCNTRGAMKFLPSLNKEEITELIGKVKLLYVIGGNPAAYAEESFKNLEFIITQNSSINETVLLSNIVLPTTCWAEKNGTFTNTSGIKQKFSETIAKPEGVLEDQLIIKKISVKIGIDLGDEK